MLRRLAGWVHSRDLEFVDVERSFSVAVGDDATMSGRVDRIERDAAGRLVIIDLKTGTTQARDADIAEHPQLGAYQLAVLSGAFEESSESGGAALVQIGGTTKDAKWQPQPPLGEAENPDWVRDLVLAVAQRYRGSEFTAKYNSRCESQCALASSCPIHPRGRTISQ